MKRDMEQPRLIFNHDGGVVAVPRQQNSDCLGEGNKVWSGVEKSAAVTPRNFSPA